MTDGSDLLEVYAYTHACGGKRDICPDEDFGTCKAQYVNTSERKGMIARHILMSHQTNATFATVWLQMSESTA